MTMGRLFFSLRSGELFSKKEIKIVGTSAFSQLPSLPVFGFVLLIIIIIWVFYILH
jgi:hypothetical protein